MSQVAFQIPEVSSGLDSGPAYIPLLLDRPGERRALAHADIQTWAAMAPVVAVARYGDPPTRNALRRRVTELQKVVGSHSVYLDLSGIDPCRRIVTPRGDRQTLDVLYEEADRRGLAYMPVARISDRQRVTGLVAQSAADHSRGLALRYRLGSRLRRTGEGPADRLLRMVESLAVTPGDVDLILDLGWLDAEAPPASSWVARQIQALAAHGEWRRIVLAGTCVPQSISKVSDLDAAGSVPRSEWSLWKKVDAATDVDLVFGDYAVQHPAPPSSNGRTYGNLRYTTGDELIVSRGHLMSNMDDADFAAMCRRVVSGGRFSGSAFSWGDSEIARIAALRRPPQTAIYDDFEDEDETAQGINNHPFWRAVATSHHLKFVAAQLAERRSVRP